MVLPPPNVTGKLHLGHALTVAVEDAICRHQRCQGNRAEWIPGFDHAGIATQAVVEKMLLKTTGKRRQDMSREEFIQECQKWSEKCSTEIRQQLSRMGASLDWNQCYYTLDPEFSNAVSHAFCTLHSDGLISRGKRIVHWCPTLGSTLSSQEVNRIDVPKDGFIIVPSENGTKIKVKVGEMHIIKYRLVDEDSEYITVGTTRPETIFADVAIAVNPEDVRYSKLVGKFVWSPVVPGRKLKIIADSGVSIEKGTGAVKITPFHDPLDYEIWSRNQEKIETSSQIFSCIDENGKMINCSPEIDGMNRFTARNKVLEILSFQKLYDGIAIHDGAQVNVCSRTGDVIEPRLAEQWFLDCKEMFERSIEAIQSGQIKVYPEYQSHRLIDWFENQEPWCLSRQLLWGHRIPAWRKPGQNDWLVTSSRDEAVRALGDVAQQDEDVLDTWFSSSLVPLVKNNWMQGEPIQTPSLNVMETGWDISGFWVARMIAMNLKLSNGNAPFGKVVLHGLVRDNEGRKMSKSLGNVIDPLDVLDGIPLEKMIERVKNSSLEDKEIKSAMEDLSKRFPNGIERCGPDALRFALLKYDVLSTDIPLDISNVAMEGLKFCNKLWNLAAYYEQLAEKCEVIKDVDSDKLVDEWIVARLSSTVTTVDEHMKNFSLHLALTTLQKFIISDICDVYLETTKQALWSNDIARIREARSTLQRVLQPTLVQLSTFMPFVSEYLYEKIFSREPGSINFDVVKPSLFIFHRNAELEQGMQVLTAVMAAMRSTRQKLQISQKLVFSGILEIQSSSMSLTPSDLKALANDVTPTCGLQLQRICGSVDEDITKEHMACPVPGHNAKLWLNIDPESRDAFIDSLRKQLMKVETRQQQFEAKVESYEAICANPKTSNVDKTRRKAENARKVVENMEGTEWIVVIVSLIHIILAPGTKVEESFNVQATHDLLFHLPTNLSNYDHSSFPGVVPRTFIGPIFLAVLSSPMSFIFRFWMIPKMWQLLLIRATLGLMNTMSFLYFARAVSRRFGRESAMFLRIIMCTQFHYIFYMSRPLPNSFAMILVMIVFERILENRLESAVRYATACVILFRCELLLLFAPLFIQFIVSGRLSLLGRDGAVAIGIRVAAMCLAVSLPIDSYFWGRSVWPEGEVMFFNVVENRSHEYGTQPFLWYFYSALPRCLLTSIALVPLGVLMDRRTLQIVIPSILFILFYSFLPHKELRFIIYVLPIFSCSAAIFCARMFINKWKSFFRTLLYIGVVFHLLANVLATAMFLLVASKNYPGFDALNYLQFQNRFDAKKPVTVYIDNACAQTGVNRFLQINDAWTYDKTENLKPEDLKNFDFLVLGTYGNNLKAEVEEKFMKWHRPLFFVNSFHQYKIQKTKKFPWIYPEIVYSEKAVVLKNRDYR
uniref:valine--tRNA ligase n=1 Tax=Caenorhabditis japonica TaxID=281687 RepID=A0A8R1I9W4_CAEJA